MSEVYEWREAPVGDFAVIGDPVDHSMSPRMHEAAYAALGLEYRYSAIRVPMHEVSAALDRLAELGYRGVNVTVPDKAEALKWANAPNDLAIRIGAANTLDFRDRSAINTDAPGFLDTLTEFEFSGEATALILGAGGSARALAVALSDANFIVSVWNRTASRATEIASEFGLETVGVPHAGYDLVVNTTSAGLQKESLPIDWSQAKPGSLAYDLVYAQTLFLSAAASNGMRTVDGRKLLVAQGARSLEWWLGMEAPRAAMLRAIN